MIVNFRLYLVKYKVLFTMCCIHIFFSVTIIPNVIFIALSITEDKTIRNTSIAYNPFVCSFECIKLCVVSFNVDLIVLSYICMYNGNVTDIRKCIIEMINYNYMFLLCSGQKHFYVSFIYIYYYHNKFGNHFVYLFICL